MCPTGTVGVIKRLPPQLGCADLASHSVPALQGVGPGISGLSGGIIYERMGMRWVCWGKGGTRSAWV